VGRGSLLQLPQRTEKLTLEIEAMEQLLTNLPPVTRQPGDKSPNSSKVLQFWRNYKKKEREGDWCVHEDRVEYIPRHLRKRENKRSATAKIPERINSFGPKK